MKFKFILSLILFTIQTAVAQTNVFPSTGSTGIGTTTPKAYLDVSSYSEGGLLSAVLGRLPEGNHINDGTYLGVRGYTTTIPSGRFSVKGFSLEHSFYGQVNSSINFFRGDDVLGGFITFNTNNNVEKMRINFTGNVGIGTSNPTDLLTVAGNIGAREVKVTTTAGADFVFEPTYNLPDLSELEKFLKINKHLPEIPTAKEMIENGIKLGELNVKLLQKIEELTLYLIEKDKEVKATKEEINTLRIETKYLKEEISCINEKIEILLKK
ncbi:tail fiber protein [Pedobacter nototheniae]|uniref:tail fiber protein n=1 Tax=Pedobacter nototheniae TaxID=2488994 RepID=UPI00103E3C63|nr:tail fiber protein [Pedobacter nototheniae]